MLVTYIDHMGTDLSVVNAAKVSFGKRSEWENGPRKFIELRGDDPLVGQYVSLIPDPEFVGKLSKQDQGLIQFLARGCTSGDWDELVEEVTYKGLFQADDDFAIHPITEEECEVYDRELRELLNHIRKMPSHWSPFAHTAITLHLKMPIFVARQIMKHTTGIEYNEISRRYVDSDPEFYVPDAWRGRSKDKKQGSDGEVDLSDIYFDTGGPSQDLKEQVEILQSEILETYSIMVESGVAPEQARMILPQSMYTEVVMTGNLYAISNLYNQRTDSHAQKETQDLAKQIGDIVKPLYPVSWEALTK